MRRRADPVWATLALILALPAQAGALDCASLAAGLGAVPGYGLSLNPAGPEDGWCVLDGAVLRSRVPGWPNLSAKTLRVAGSAEAVEVELTGLRVAPALADRSVDERLRAMFRLQTADLSLSASHSAKDDRLSLSRSSLILSGGSALRLTAEVAGASLDPATLLGGSLMRMTLEWDSDGRLLRPLMELLGERLSGATGGQAVDDARDRLAALVDALPDSAVPDESRAALAAFVEDLPQGKGRLVLTIDTTDGIGAARVAIAALSPDPLAPDALARLLDGATISARWQPGLLP